MSIGSIIKGHLFPDHAKDAPETSAPAPSTPPSTSTTSYNADSFNLNHPNTSSVMAGLINGFNNYESNKVGSRPGSLANPLPGKEEVTATAKSSDMQVMNAPTGSDFAAELAQMAKLDANPQNRSQTFRLANGNVIAYQSYVDDAGQKNARFAITDPSGKQVVPSVAGEWQNIDASTNGGKGTVDVGGGQFMNFDMNGFSVDNHNKNKGNPLTIGANGNLVVN